MNVIDLLKEDHDIVDALFKQVEATPPSRHEALFKRIKGELDTHAHVEETIFYPTLQKRGNKDLVDIVKEGFEEHKQIKMFLAELDGKTSKNQQFDAKLKVLIEDTRHHVKEEENEMFPMVEEQFNFDELDKLGAEIEAEKKKFQSANKIKPESREKARGPIGRLVQAVTGVFTDEKDKETPKTRQGTVKKPRTVSTRGAKAPVKKKGNGKAAASRTRAKATSKTSKPASKKRGATKSKTTAKPAKKRSTKSPSRSTKKPAGKSARAGR
jgi:iron-sulfur cluster repair protein YtfE (RIC family)